MISPEQRRVWALGLIAFAVVAPSLLNGFVYDDPAIIVANPAVHSLDAMGRAWMKSYWPAATAYRPFTINVFTLQWVAGGGSPVVFHSLSVLLAVGCAIALYDVGRQVLPSSAAWVSAALFAAHPVHVEATANVVGQSELLVALVSLTAVGRYLAWRQSGNLGGRERAILALLYFVGIASKEHGFVLPALLLAAECTVIRDPRPLGIRVRSLVPVYAVLTGVALIGVGLNAIVVGGLGAGQQGPTLSGLSGVDRAIGMLAIVPEWARLLVWPARLQAEYGPPGLSVTGAFGARHGIGLVLLLAWLAAVLGTFRRFPVIAFGLVWVAVSLAPISNTVIPTGIVLAERTLFLPSAGMMLAIGAGWSLLYEHTRAPKHRRSVVTAMTALVLGLGLARSAERATMWRSQEHFFARLPREAPTTYRSHRAAAQYFAHSGRPAQAERAWQRVLQLYDRDGTAFEELGQLYRARRRCDLALPVFEDGLSKHPDRTPLRSRYIECLLALGDTGRAIRAAEAGLRLGLTEFEQVITRLGGVR